MKKKCRIVLRLVPGGRYRVEKLMNMTVPAVGSYLKKEEVEKWVGKDEVGGYPLEVEIRDAKR